MEAELIRLDETWIYGRVVYEYVQWEQNRKGLVTL